MNTTSAEVTPEAEPSRDSQGTQPTSLPEANGATEGRTRRPRPFLWIAAIATVMVVLAISLLLPHKSSSVTRAEKNIPENAAQTLRLKGTTEAVESRAILAPLLSGQQVPTLTIIRLTRGGTRVKKGDVLVEFDRQA